MLLPQNILAWLLGAWTFKREVSGLATMKGHAYFVEAGPDKVSYEEKADMRLRDGQKLKASQQYVFFRSPDGFSVYFPPGDEESAIESERLFHSVSFFVDEEGCLRGRAEHCCKADIYISMYATRPNGDFTIRHDVRGPRKDYNIQTLYRRGTATGGSGLR